MPKKNPNRTANTTTLAKLLSPIMPIIRTLHASEAIIINLGTPIYGVIKPEQRRPTKLVALSMASYVERPAQMNMYFRRVRGNSQSKTRT